VKKYAIGITIILVFFYITLQFYNLFFEAPKNNVSKSNIKQIIQGRNNSHTESDISSLLKIPSKEIKNIANDEEKNIQNKNEQIINDEEWNFESTVLVENAAHDFVSSREAWIENTECRDDICKISISASSNAPSIDLTAVKMMKILRDSKWNTGGQIRILSMNKNEEPHTFELALGRYSDSFPAPITVSSDAIRTVRSMPVIKQ